MMKIVLATPRGFCAGVDRAIAIVEKALEKFGAPIYVRHEVVHNKYVIETLKQKGAIFIEELCEVPAGSTVIFSAHGVSQAVREEAEALGLNVFDATCPLVTRVHLQVKRLRESGLEVVMIGHKGHPEVEGTMGQAEGGMYLVGNVADVEALEVADPDKLAWVTQTTLSVDDTRVITEALQQRFPKIISPKKDDICYATQNRQDAVRQLARDVDVLIVVGSPNSSNSNRLREVATSLGTDSWMVDDETELKPEWFQGKKTVGITAGASAPEVLVERVSTKIREYGATEVRTMDGIEENVVFTPPKGLQ